MITNLVDSIPGFYSKNLCLSMPLPVNVGKLAAEGLQNEYTETWRDKMQLQMLPLAAMRRFAHSTYMYKAVSKHGDYTL